ncbi:MAG: tannase/feruloyl esterase family alpha/beta hydrolase [Solirubrobacteraceae bacterium]
MGRVLTLAAVLLAALAAPARAATCPNADRVTIPGADRQERHCLDDLTTAANRTSGRTDPTDWSGLHAEGTRNPSGVPGLQVEGHFPDDSTTNSWQARNHDSQFVIRLPHRWNGKLVITGAPGVRRQYANDFIISDWVLARGYAFAATDKGNTGTAFYRDGEQPGDAVAEWHRRVAELTRASKEVVRLRYGRGARRTYVTGISNGGYLTRYALENSPELYDGGVDWEGTLMHPAGPNLFTYLPVAIRNYLAWKRGDEAAHQAILAAGFEPGSEFLWDYHEVVYWDLTQRIYREEFDPAYDGLLEAGIPFCQSGTPACDADYDYASRPQAVKDAVGRVSNSGRIGKPMLTLHGTLDALLPIRTDSDVYTRMVRAAGRGPIHRYYVIDQGTHVDSLYDDFPDRLRPILPCYRAAFVALERWVERGEAPPPSQVVPKGEGDVVNSCRLADSGGNRPK